MTFRRANLKELVSDPNYWLLYLNTIEKYGGWTKFVDQMSPHEFDELLKRKKDNAKDVCHMIDYRFRHLDHGGDPTLAKITHGRFFRWKQISKALNGRTLQARWDEQKNSAIPLYVSETFGFDLFPDLISEKTFSKSLKAKASDAEKIELFFRRCKYVDHTLKSGASSLRLPELITPARPETTPPSPADIQLMENYRREVADMISPIGDVVPNLAELEAPERNQVRQKEPP